jgi:hypothetical protein
MHGRHIPGARARVGWRAGGITYMRGHLAAEQNALGDAHRDERLVAGAEVALARVDADDRELAPRGRVR